MLCLQVWAYDSSMCFVWHLICSDGSLAAAKTQRTWFVNGLASVTACRECNVTLIGPNGWIFNIGWKPYTTVSDHRELYVSPGQRNTFKASKLIQMKIHHASSDQLLLQCGHGLWGQQLIWISPQQGNVIMLCGNGKQSCDFLFWLFNLYRHNCNCDLSGTSNSFPSPTGCEKKSFCDTQSNKF